MRFKIHLHSIKPAILILSMCVVMVMFSGIAYAQNEGGEQNETELDRIKDSPEIEEMREQWEDLTHEMDEYVPQLGFWDLLNLIRGESDEFRLSNIFTGLIEYFFHELMINFRLLGKVILLSVLAVLFTTLQNAFGNESIGELAHSVIFITVVVIAMQSFYVAVGIGREAVSNMVEIILALIPLLLTLMASMGAVSSVAIFHPLSLFLINTVSALINDIIFPLLLISAVLSVVHHLHPKFNLASLAGLFQYISVTALGFFMTIFIGIMGLQGVGGAVADGISIRAAKFLTGSFIPVVGKALSDAVETVMGASLVLTNSITMAGAIILFFVTIFPAIKILALVFIYKLAASLIEPLGANRISDSLNTMSKCLALVFAGVATVCVMFFIAIAAIIGAANISMMIRG